MDVTGDDVTAVPIRLQHGLAWHTVEGERVVRASTGNEVASEAETFGSHLSSCRRVAYLEALETWGHV